MSLIALIGMKSLGTIISIKMTKSFHAKTSGTVQKKLSTCRFVRLVEGMGIGFTFDSAFWLGKVIANGVSKGTIKAVKPLDQDLFNWMRKNKPENFRYNPK